VAAGGDYLAAPARVPRQVSGDGGEGYAGRREHLEALPLVRGDAVQIMGPNLHLAPKILLDDGMFDLVMVQDGDREKRHEQLTTWQEGALWPSEFKTRQGAHLEIEWKGFPVHIDDKIWPEEGEKPKRAGEIELTIEPKALEFLVPKDLPDPQLQR